MVEKQVMVMWINVSGMSRQAADAKVEDMKERCKIESKQLIQLFIPYEGETKIETLYVHV